MDPEFRTLVTVLGVLALLGALYFIGTGLYEVADALRAHTRVMNEILALEAPLE